MEFIWWSTRIVLWIGVLIVLIQYPRISPFYRLIGSYLFLSLIVDIVNTYYETSTGYNLFIIPVYSFFELLLYSIIYYQYLLKRKSIVGFYALIICFLLIVLDALFLSDLFNAKFFTAFSKVLADLVIVVMALCCYSEILQGIRPYNKVVFYLNTVFLGYFLLNSLVFLSINFLVNASLNIVIPFWAANALSALFLYAFLTYIIWQHGNIKNNSQFGSESS